MPALTLPHVRDGLNVRRMAVFCTFSTPSMYRHMHRQLMRNALHNFTTMVPVTVYHQGSYVETYSRCKPTVSPLMIPLVYCHIKSFQRASSVEKPLPGGENRIDGRAAHPVEW